MRLVTLKRKDLHVKDDNMHISLSEARDPELSRANNLCHPLEVLNIGLDEDEFITVDFR